MAYNTIIDYSDVLGGKILPFQVELDLPNCVLNPDSGSNQKYSYIITGKGGGNTEHLTSFILGVEENISSEQIENITVVIGGVAQTVRYGVPSSNVSLVISGLRFDFQLNKNNGEMVIGFELTTPYKVGSIPVSLLGNGTTKTGLTIGGPFSLPFIPDSDPEDYDPEDPGSHEKKCFKDQLCKKFSYNVYDVSVPVTIKPFAKPHKPEVSCIGDAKVYPHIKHCGCEHDSFDLTITQKIFVKTPVQFGVKTCYGKSCVEEGEDESFYG